MTDLRTVSVLLRRPFRDVYPFLADPANVPRWSKFVTAIAPDGDEWQATTLHGTCRMRFTPTNDFGVVDHWVSTNAEKEIYVPLRVLDHGEETAVLFTVFRLPGMSDQEYQDDIALVEKDLAHLKQLLEV